MPNIGETKRASEIGYKGHALYQYSVCSSCGELRWARVPDLEQGRSLTCRSCGYPASNIHKAKLRVLRAAGAKRASELGKPVGKNRDPWYYPHTCSNCGKPTWHQSKDLHRVCKECAYLVRETASGINHPNWKGGQYHHVDGYIFVQLLPDSPYYSMAHARGYVLEHRILMAKNINRCLLTSEVVHHINGNKQDNRIENLELLPNNASHLPYIQLQQQVMKLEEQVGNQQSRIKLLEWHIRELEHANPELASSINCPASVETLQEAHPSDGEEKVHPSGKSED